MDNNINLNLYKDFYLVAKYGSLSKAASNGFTSAPAISKSIKKLESILNRQLFYRTNDGMTLTNYGKKLMFYVEESFNSLNTAERFLKEEDSLEIGNLTIGIPSNIGSFYLFDNLMKFHELYPKIEITMVTGSTTKLIELLETHAVDFVIDTSPINIKLSDDYIIKELDREDYCFCKNTNYKTKKISSIKDLLNYQLILPIKGTANRTDLDKVLKDKNIEVSNSLNLHTSEMIISAVKKQIGIGYVIKKLVENEDNIEVLNIKEDLPETIINIIYNTKYLTTVPKKFINMYIDNSIE